MAKKIILIDSAVPDFNLILADLGPDSSYYILDNTRDGLSQMADILSGYAGLDSIHIFSHGSSGNLQLGNSFITPYTLGDYSAAPTTIGNFLSATGDILLYGCDVAQGVQGQDFINAFANATGADVAGSTDLAGATFLSEEVNGNLWNGRIERKPNMSIANFLEHNVKKLTKEFNHGASSPSTNGG